MKNKNYVTKISKSSQLGYNLKRLREAHDFTQEILAAKLQSMGLDIARYTYAKIEQGRASISVEVLFALHDIYKCSFDDIFLGQYI